MRLHCGAKREGRVCHFRRHLLEIGAEGGWKRFVLFSTAGLWGGKAPKPMGSGQEGWDIRLQPRLGLGVSSSQRHPTTVTMEFVLNAGCRIRLPPSNSLNYTSFLS